MFFVLASVGLLVAALYLGRHLFVPLALAVLLTLLLSPVVSRLERWGLKRFPAVLSVTLLAFGVIGVVGWAVTVQVTSLLADLPKHKTNLRTKIAQFRQTAQPGSVGSLQDFLDEIETEGPSDQAAPEKGPVVRVQPAKPSLFAQLQPIVLWVLGVFSAALAVVLLVITLLLYREDTRNRLIRLAGRGRLTVTTRALDEAAHRIGGYLLGHAAVNAGFGAAVTLGLLALSIPYPLLWGMLAAAFRFVPSIGIWLIAPLPAALGFITGTGFLLPFLVLGMFLVLDLITTNVAERRVCGKSVGLATVPLLLAVTFWTGLWGIVGFVLATPLTVCLAVLGRHVRQLRFLAVLLGKEAALHPAVRYYQRLIARDRYEAETVVKEYLADHSTLDLFDHVLIPALGLVRRGRKAGELRSEDEEFILGTTREIVNRSETSVEVTEILDGTPRVAVLGIPAVDGADEVSLAMLCIVIRQAGTEVQISTVLPTRSVRSSLQDAVPTAVLVSAVRPGGITEARYLCRSLRDQHPGVKIVVGRWGRKKSSRKTRTLLLSAGADRVAITLREARDHLARFVHPLLPAAEVGSPAV
jgi:predicted PurR-regulated permease PerM